MHQSVYMDYFDLVVGKDVDYEIYQGIYLPHIVR
jgi:hypothetical protein